MRAILLALLAMGTVTTLGSTSASAGYWGEAFCMRTNNDVDDCSYYTYRQCQATSSGLGTYCFANPAGAYRTEPYEDPAPRKRKRRHAR